MGKLVCAGFLVLGLGVADALAEDRLTPEQALRLMKLDEELHKLESTALEADTDYAAKLEQAKTAEAALAKHRAAFEAERNADETYAKLRKSFDELNSQKGRLEQELVTVTRDYSNSSRTVSSLKAKAGGINASISKWDRELAKHQARYDLISTTTATTLAGYAYLEKKISDCQSALTTERTKLSSIEMELQTAESQQATAQEQLKGVRASTLEVKAALAKLAPEFAAVEKTWEDKYIMMEKTTELDTAHKDAMKAEAAARRARLTALNKENAEYASKLKERIAIKPLEE